MNSTNNPIPQNWKRCAQTLRWQVNLGWFWFYFSRGLVVSAGLTAVLLWLLRVQKADLLPAWILGLGCGVVSALVAQTASAGKRIGIETALSRLDVGWQMNHRLVSAWRGVGGWPVFPSRKLPLRLRPAQLWLPWALSLFLLTPALFLPLPPQEIVPDFTRVEPPDWQSLETLADELEQQKLVQEDATRTLKRELAQLREKPKEEWYDPSTLEATDRLRSRMQSDAERLQQAIANTSALLNLAEQGKGHLSTPQQQAMQEFLQEMREQMAGGGLKLNKDLLQQLQQVDLSQLQQIDPQALQQLEQALMQNQQEMESALMAAGLISGPGEDGAGGVNDGGGPSALTLRDFETIAEPVVPMALDPGKLENARIGDLLDLRETEHSDEREAVSATAGSLKSSGGSGEVVWEQDVLPDEQKVLKDFFK